MTGFGERADRENRAFAEATAVLTRHLPAESAQVITEHARRSLSPEAERSDSFADELVARISQASAVFLAPNVRLRLLGELRMTLANDGR